MACRARCRRASCLAPDDAADRRHRQSPRQRAVRSDPAGVGPRRRGVADPPAADAGRDAEHAGRRQLQLLRSEREPSGHPRLRWRSHPHPAERRRAARCLGDQRRPRGRARDADDEAHRSGARTGHAALWTERDRRRGQRHRRSHPVRGACRHLGRGGCTLRVARFGAGVCRRGGCGSREGPRIPRRRLHAQDERPAIPDYARSARLRETDPLPPDEDEPRGRLPNSAGDSDGGAFGLAFNGKDGSVGAW